MKWNGRQLKSEPGEYEYMEVVRDEPDLKVTVTYKYWVKRRLFYGVVKLVQVEGYSQRH